MQYIEFEKRVTVTLFALQQGIRSASRLFRVNRKTIRRWLKAYHEAIQTALAGDNWFEGYYGRTAREACLLTPQQRREHCNEKDCDSWPHCPVRNRQMTNDQ